MLSFGSIAAQASATITFQSLRLQDLYDRIWQEDPITLDYTEDDSTAVIRFDNCDVPIKINVSPDGTLTHLGIALALPGTSIVSDSLLGLCAEREALDLFLGAESWLGLHHRIAAARGVEWFYNDLELRLFHTLKRERLCECLLAAETLELSRTTSGFEFSWQSGDNRLRLQLMPREDLILGLDKREWDAAFLADLKAGLMTTAEEPGQVIEMAGPYLEIPGVFHAPEEGYGDSSGSLVYAEALPAESLRNLLLCPNIIGKQVQVLIHHKDLDEKIQTELSRLLAFFNSEHAVHIALEEGAPQTLDFYFIMQSRAFSHLHLLSGSISVAELFSPDPIILDLSLTPNIRQDNLISLFDSTELLGGPHGR